MRAAVPGDIDEADKLAAFPGAGPAQAVPVHLSPPVVAERLMAEAFRMQRVDLDVVKRLPPARIARTVGKQNQSLAHQDG